MAAKALLREIATEGEPLSRRELEVLQIASHGATNRQIAARLGVTVHTVKFHLASSYRKLGASNRTDAIVRALRAGLTTDDIGGPT